MKKRMFNDKFGLTNMVIQGKKTMTSDILPELGAETELVGTNEKGEFEFRIGGNYETVAIKPKFKVGEVVAVAESYRSIYDRGDWNYRDTPDLIDRWNTPGWSNKMFVRPELMPNQIRIKNVKCERLQQISDKDCIKEGVIKFPKNFAKGRNIRNKFIYHTPYTNHYFDSAVDAFLPMVEKIFGRSTWERNPYRIAYEFTLTKPEFTLTK